MASSSNLDLSVRFAAFRWLSSYHRADDELWTWRELIEGFPFEGTQVPLISQRGIWKPRLLPDMPLSIATSPNNPYGDVCDEDGTIVYHHCGANPDHSDNRGLRLALERRAPLVYLQGVVKGMYLVAWPAYVVGEDRSQRVFRVQVDEKALVVQGPELFAADWARSGADVDVRRRYVTASVRRRLHQRTFREHVLAAYARQCALCRLKHPELLDAAHIVPDRERQGVARVSNGLALCKLHHAAYDENVLGIRPDYVVEVREDVLEEVDGPMLAHGLKAMQGVGLSVPRSTAKRPDRALLERRYEEFRDAY